MGARIYIDTDVWRNYWDFEKFDFRTVQLLDETATCKFIIIISGLILKELERAGVQKQKMQDLFSKFQILHKVEHFDVTQNDVVLAKKLQKKTRIHFSDCLHAAIAIKNHAIVVTRNIKHFSAFETEVQAFRPEEILGF